MSWKMPLIYTSFLWKRKEKGKRQEKNDSKSKGWRWTTVKGELLKKVFDRPVSWLLFSWEVHLDKDIVSCAESERSPVTSCEAILDILSLQPCLEQSKGMHSIRLTLQEEPGLGLIYSPPGNPWENLILKRRPLITLCALFLSRESLESRCHFRLFIFTFFSSTSTVRTSLFFSGHMSLLLMFRWNKGLITGRSVSLHNKERTGGMKRSGKKNSLKKRKNTNDHRK